MTGIRNAVILIGAFMAVVSAMAYYILLQYTPHENSEALIVVAIIGLSSLGIVIGFSAYYFIHASLKHSVSKESKENENTQAKGTGTSHIHQSSKPTNAEGHIHSENIHHVLTLLESDERKVVKHLVHHGNIAQSKLGHDLTISKVKISRIIKRLSERGVVEKKSHGMTNVIALSPNLNEVLRHGKK